MPLILLTGYPSSGKTHRASQLHDFFTTKLAENTSSSTPDAVISRQKLHLISTHNLGLSRDVYSDVRAEKDARAAQYSAVKRVLGKDTIVIVDAPNYIKGFRYQLYCEAKAVGTASCVIHAASPIATCRETNAHLLSQSSPSPNPNPDVGPYPAPIFEDLISRYEEPNGMTRWDSPLFTVLHDDPTPPFPGIYAALFSATGRSKIVKPHQATVLKGPTAPSHLYLLDRLTSEIVTLILAHQADHRDDGAAGGEVRVPDVQAAVELPPSGPLSLPQLQRMRRQYVAMKRLPMMAVGSSGGDGEQGGEAEIKRGFVDYLNGQFLGL